VGRSVALFGVLRVNLQTELRASTFAQLLGPATSSSVTRAVYGTGHGWSRSGSSRAVCDGASAERKRSSRRGDGIRATASTRHGRFIAATFEVEVTILANVIAFKPPPAPKKSRGKASR
jgi:hypothetical protein